MKIVALNEIHYVDPVTKKSAVAKPGDMPNFPSEIALALCSGALPAARRLTEAEIAIEKLKAQAAAVTASESDDEDEDGPAPAPKQARGRKPAADKADEKADEKADDKGGY